MADFSEVQVSTSKSAATVLYTGGWLRSHTATAAMSNYLSELFAGTANPLWPHLVLIAGSILAGAVVGAGIIFESTEYSAAIHRVAKRLVIAGVVVESLCTVCLFVFDETVTGAQQSQIIALEKRLSARALSDSQCAAIVQRVRPFAGQVFQVIPYWRNPESLSIANRIADCAINAGWRIEEPKNYTTLIGVITGIDVDLDRNAPAESVLAAKTLVDALNNNSVRAALAMEGNDPAHTALISLSVGIKP